jgi:hypothetical protein
MDKPRPLTIDERHGRTDAALAAEEARGRIAEKGFDYLARRNRHHGEVMAFLKRFPNPERHPAVLLRAAWERAERFASQMPLQLTNR